MTQTLKIYLIAGEASGDLLGSALMRSLRQVTNQPITFLGIGGQSMQTEGLQSLFPMQELSLMGFSEIIPHLPKLFKRIQQTLHHIREVKPDIVVTIDSPGFNCQIAKRLKDRSFPLVHYVAPSVWAYKPKRAKKFAKLFDHLLALLPFEPPYFEKEGLATSFVGHPIVENLSTTPIDPKSINTFKKQHHIPQDATLLLAMPGSRITEIKRLLPIYLECFGLLKKSIPNLQILIPTVPGLRTPIKKLIKDNTNSIHLIDNQTEKQLAYEVCQLGLIKSGTSTLEVAKAKIPMIVAYKVSYITYRLIKAMIRIPYASLINIIANKLILPEYLQQDCTAPKLAAGLLELHQNLALRQTQLSQTDHIFNLLGQDAPESPSIRAAKAVLACL